MDNEYRDNYNEYQNNQVNSHEVEPASSQKKKHKASTGVKVVAVALACAMVGGVTGGAAMTGVLHLSGNSVQTAAQTDSSNELQMMLDTKDNNKSLTPQEVYAQNVNSVVGILATTNVNVFGQVSSSAASGTGFVISSDGYIITNCHVIEGSDSIEVSMYDGSTYNATVVGEDSTNDIALLKIEASNLQPVSIGDSAELQVGEMVVAIGNPLGELTYSQTVGYISALDRTINTDGTPINMLQTDAAINPGNSGGPLLDMDGNVIGITTAKYASDEIEGLGFAIPINDAITIAYDLMQYGYVQGRPNLGITVRDLNQMTASAYNLPMGVYVDSVNSGSCSEKAGMQAGDIITAVDDNAVLAYTDLVSELTQHQAGDTITITVYRSGTYQDLKVTLDEKKPETEATSTDESQVQQQSGSVNPSSPWSFFGY
jgi:serine protease Do